MLRKFRSHLTYANVVSTLCLFILLGGSAYAAAKIGSKQIKDNSIRSKDVKNKSLLSKDFKSGQLPAGARGATGTRGATGSRGPAGSSAASVNTGVMSGSSDQGFGTPSGKSTYQFAEDGVASLSPAGHSIVARDLSVRTSVAAETVNPHTFTYTLYANGLPTSLSCVVPPGGSTCQDITHAVSIAPSQTIALRFADAGTGSIQAPTASFGWRAVTP